MKTVGPSGCVVPDREVQRLDTLEEMVHEGMWTVDPSFFAHSTVHCSVMLGRMEKGKPLKLQSLKFQHSQISAQIISTQSQS
jgi:hypothetical protein